MGTEEPPGITAFSLCPLRTPPAMSSNSRNGVPKPISKFPGRFTCPDTENSFSPPAFFTPKLENQSPPWRKIVGTEDRVSTLLIVVGRPYKPKLAGNGGLKRG